VAKTEPILKQHKSQPYHADIYALLLLDNSSKNLLSDIGAMLLNGLMEECHYLDRMSLSMETGLSSWMWIPLLANLCRLMDKLSSRIKLIEKLNVTESG